MSNVTKQKFLVLYLIPQAVMTEWMKTDPAKREADEQKMKADWGKWTN